MKQISKNEHAEVKLPKLLLQERRAKVKVYIVI